MVESRLMGLLQTHAETVAANKDRLRSNTERDPLFLVPTTCTPEMGDLLDKTPVLHEEEKEEEVVVPSGFETPSPLPPRHHTFSGKLKKHALSLKNRSRLRRRFSLTQLKTALASLPSPQLTPRSGSTPGDTPSPSLVVRYKRNPPAKKEEDTTPHEPIIALPASPESTRYAMHFLTNIPASPPKHSPSILTPPTPAPALPTPASD